MRSLHEVISESIETKQRLLASDDVIHDLL